MTNIEHKLTVDDLIMEYLIYKTNNGYEPNFKGKEFEQFLIFISSKFSIKDIEYDRKTIFPKFFVKKLEEDWSRNNIVSGKREYDPHINITYLDDEQDFLIEANYKLSSFDESVLNTYFMDNGMSKYNEYQGQRYAIRKAIGEFLVQSEQRRIKYSADYSREELIGARFAAAQIIKEIWNGYINDLIQLQKWPIQCRDIQKYLIDIDLAEIINVKSIKPQLKELFDVLTTRITTMYHEDKHLKISSDSESYLATANYKFLVKDYDDLFKKIKGSQKIVIDFEKFNLVEPNTVDCLDNDNKQFQKKNNNEEVMMLARKLSETKDSLY